MRRAAAAWLALLVAAFLPGPGLAARPLQVMSINTCGDQLLLALLPPSQITSVTSLSRDASSSIMAAAAMRTGVNHGAVEEVIRDKPDLVIAGAYTTPATRLLLKQLRLPLVELQPADSFADIRRETRRIAAAVGASPRGEALIARMDAVLADLARHPGPPLRVAAWDGGGFAAQPGSMYDALIRAAGARNVATDVAGLGRGPPGVERLLRTAPDLLVEGEPGFEPSGLRTAVVNNPIVLRFWGDRTLRVPAAYYACGTPFTADGARLLRDEMRAMAARARSPLPFARPEAP
jgi:iron complex transport system substrate-binding protein